MAVGKKIGEFSLKVASSTFTHPWLIQALVIIGFAVVTGALARADRGALSFRAQLRGANEVPPISTAATGTLKATISDDRTAITYTLSYTALEGGAVLFAHFHFAQPRVNGGVMVFLCNNAPGVGAPADTPPCPNAPSGQVSGTLTAADVVGPSGQGISAGEFDRVLAAIESGESYTNVHTAEFSTGEIRGQNVVGGFGHGDGQ